MARPGYQVAALALLLMVAPVAAEPAGALLSSLPTAVRGSLASLFMANAIGQTGLNGQMKGTPQGQFAQLKAALTKAGYAEQPIRTSIGAWGFSATWAPPSGRTVDGTPQGQAAVLVTQATALSPDSLNLNIRFEAIAPDAAAPAPQPTQQPSRAPAGIPGLRGLF